MKNFSFHISAGEACFLRKREQMAETFVKIIMMMPRSSKHLELKKLWGPDKNFSGRKATVKVLKKVQLYKTLKNFLLLKFKKEFA